LVGERFWQFDFSEPKLAADLRSYSFADSEAVEQEFALRFSAEYLSDGFMKIHDLWPNTALEPTPTTP
jgi:hypothetical protein